MSTFNFYLWVSYGLSAIGLIYLWWHVAKSIKKRFVRDSLLGLLILLLLTPWFVHPEQPELAPAIIIFIHDLVFSGNKNALWALKPLAWSYLFFVVILAVCYWIVHRIGLNSIHPDIKRPTDKQQN